MKWNIGSSSSSTLPTGHPSIASSSGKPPAECPMHTAPPVAAPAPASCPIPHDRRTPIPPPNPNRAESSSKVDKGASCPIPHDQRALHPLNAIPLGLSATEKSPGQIHDLPIEREISSIPRPKVGDETDAEHSGRWEYPSPQQFYNALVRKGQGAPEEHIEMVVAIHNFLNERAWDEVMKWETRLPNGQYAQLERFQGRPGELSPKARFHLWAGTIFPSKFNTEPPFDRHDWVVTRPVEAPVDAQASTMQSAARAAVAGASASANGSGSGNKTGTISTRYVIDYYSAPDDEEGNPVFSLDVRPALDSFESISLRVRVGVEEWLKGE